MMVRLRASFAGSSSCIVRRRDCNAMLLHYVLVLLVWITLIRTCSWVTRPGLQRAYCLTLLGLASFLTLLLPPMYLAVDRISGVPNIARLLAASMLIFGLWAFQPCVAETLNRPLTSRSWPTRTPFVLGLIAILAVVFTLAPIDRSEPGDFTAQYGDDPFVFGFNLLYMGYMALGFGLLFLESVRAVRKYRGLLADREMRLRMYAITTAWSLSVAYWLHGCGYSLLVHLGKPYVHPDPSLVANSLLTAAILAMMSGGLFDLHDWWTQYRAHRSLYPLWRAVVEATPGIAFFPARPYMWDLLEFRDMRLRLHRRVVEVHDGVVALRPFIDSAFVIEAEALCRHTGLTGEEARATVEAASVARALVAKGERRMAKAPFNSLLAQAGTDFRTEVGYLQRVATAYQRSRVVSDLLTRQQA